MQVVGESGLFVPEDIALVREAGVGAVCSHIVFLFNPIRRKLSKFLLCPHACIHVWSAVRTK
jgi:hypothetical protein